MKVFITGANGFVGSNLCRSFKQKGWDVYGLVRRTSDLHYLNGSGVHLVFGDLLDAEKVEIPEGVDYLIHSASLVSDMADDETCRKNIYLLCVNLARKVLEMERPPKRLVYISTALTLGYNGVDISEDRPGKSASSLPYTRYKIRSEEYFLEQWKTRRLPVVILRPGDVYGPNDRTSCALILKGCEDGAPLIVGRGHGRFGFCYIDNLCQAAHLALLTEGVEGRTYTVTNRKLPTWRDFFSGLQKGLHRKQRVYVPVWFAFAVAGIMEGVKKAFPRVRIRVNRYRIKRITTETTYDISKTIEELGYAPDDGMERQFEEIVTWYLKERERGFIK